MDELETKVGFLLKKSPSLFGQWQKRFFMLKDRRLKWYLAKKNRSSMVQRGVINFDEFTCRVQMKSGSCISISIEGQKRTFLIRAESGAEAKEWLFCLNRHLLASSGFSSVISANKLRKPWKFENISERQFIEEADTGDLLLF